MKKDDWLKVIVIVAIAAIASFIISNKVFGGKSGAFISVEDPQPISSDFELPNTKYFNKDALNPTQLIEIGKDNNQSPFNGQ